MPMSPLETAARPLAARPRLHTAQGGALMAMGSMSSVQLGLALSVPLFAQLGALGTAGLRLAWAGLLVLLLIRPRPRDFARRDLLASVLLGLVTAGMVVLFMLAAARIPLGTASALEFLGPLAVSLLRSGGRKHWAVLAGLGVVLLTEPWQGGIDPAGLGFALGAAACWGAYILLTQRVGDQVTGLKGLAVSLPVAGVVATLVAAPSGFGRLTWPLLLVMLGLAVLSTVVPYTLEFLALRRLSAGAFGTLMSLEPAIALVMGLLVLGQVPGAAPAVGVVLVVIAGAGATRTGAREAEPVQDTQPVQGVVPVRDVEPRQGVEPVREGEASVEAEDREPALCA